MVPATSRASFLLVPVALGLFGIVSGCTRNDPPRVQLGDIERCERGVEAAMREPGLKEGLRTYYRECANVYVEPGCKDAMLKAGELPHSEQLRFIADGCRQAYCPLFQDRGLAICQGGTPSSAAALERDWTPLHQRILEHDAKGLAPRISRVMVMFYLKSQQWLTPPAPSASATEAPPAGAAEGLPAPGASGSGTPGSVPAPLPSGSAPTPQPVAPVPKSPAAPSPSAR